MTANKPETAVQGCAFFSLGSHTFCYHVLYVHVHVHVHLVLGIYMYIVYTTGSCPKCEVMLTQLCHCGRSQRDVRCDENEEEKFECTRTCGKSV